MVSSTLPIDTSVAAPVVAPVAPKRKRKRAVTKAPAKPNKKAKVLPSKKSVLLGPRSTWINFISTKRAELPADTVVTFGSLCRDLSPVWHGMTAAEKQPYVDMYHADKARYERDRASLTTPQKAILRALRRRRRADRLDHPRVPLSAYMRFVATERAVVVDAYSGQLSFKEIGEELGRRWRTLSDAEKQPMFDAANADKIKYTESVTAFHAARKLNTTLKVRRGRAKAVVAP